MTKIFLRTATLALFMLSCYQVNAAPVALSSSTATIVASTAAINHGRTQRIAAESSNTESDCICTSCHKQIIPFGGGWINSYKETNKVFTYKCTRYGCIDKLERNGHTLYLLDRKYLPDIYFLPAEPGKENPHLDPYGAEK